jgi:beta-galactosidase
MKKKIALIFSVCLCTLFSIPAGAQQSSVLFDNGWKFHLGNAADPEKDFNYGTANIFSKTGKAEHTAIAIKFDDANWQDVQLPHDWVVPLPFVHDLHEDIVAHGFKPVGGLYPQNSIGWYRKHFQVAHSDSGQRLAIQFDGIFRDSKVWINGFYLGTNESGYLGVSYDITDFINFGGDNVIVVRADATQSEGWFYEGAGIYRHAWLNKYDNVHIVKDGIFIHSSIEKNKATVYTDADIENRNLTTADATAITYITNRAGKIIAQSDEQHMTLKPNEKKTVSNALHVSEPRLWSPDDPYLYRAIVVIKSANGATNTRKMRFGIRTISMDSKKGFYLNGENIKIHGVNCHQDHAGLGTALPDYLQYYRIRLLKDMGANAYRTSHYAPTPELLDACDSLGMLVLDEQRLLNSGTEYITQFERLLKRDRSRACVFLWSIGNEEGYVQWNSYGKRLAQTMVAKAHELDPTRTCTYAADMANVYHGVNEIIPVRGFNYREYAVDSYHMAHPLQPIIGTEMGSTVTTRGQYAVDTVHGYIPDQDITAPWWASKAETWWKLCAAQPWWMGGFIWTGFDYRGEPTPYEWPDINSNFGMMDMCGFPKNIYYYYQSWWTDKDVLHLSANWNNKKTGEPVDVWVNSNADNVELFLNGKSLGKKDMPRNSHLQWTVSYAPGTLSAVAYKKGRKLQTKLETTGAPYEVVVAPSKTTMIADGQDASVMDITVIDKEGREIPDANNLLKFTVSGPGRIIGVGNGDPGSHEADQCDTGKWQRHLFNGKCQVIVQSTEAGGEIKFDALSDGLYKAGTTVVSIHPGTPHAVTDVHNTFTTLPADDKKELGRMMGADISFLPELEDKGIKFSDKNVQKDAIEILKDHGINYIRLRIFNDPARDSGYSPGKGFCDLAHTLQMAKRIKGAGMKFLLDFHYSDYWADPQQQYMPKAWRGENIDQLKQSVYDYTKSVIEALKAQGTLPDMVQVGNEINHGMIWPAGAINNLDTLSQLIYAGVSGVRAVAPSTVIMLHIALGGQNDESRFFLDNMTVRKVPFDVIGLSYYPRWHSTLDDLRDNVTDLAARYGKDVVVVEYSQRKQEVHDIIFNVPGNKGKGAFIWEPLSTWEGVFDHDGRSKDIINVYDQIRQQYDIK